MQGIMLDSPWELKGDYVIALPSVNLQSRNTFVWIKIHLATNNRNLNQQWFILKWRVQSLEVGIGLAAQQGH